MNVLKILNNNALLAKASNGDEYVYLANGIGFQNKVNKQLVAPGGKDQKRYKLTTSKEENNSLVDKLSKIESKYIEISAHILSLAEEKFKEVDENILLPLADHISFAIERIKKNMDISNPFTSEIQLLFPEEYNVALQGKHYITKRTGIEVNNDEVSYITLHIHSAITSEHVSLSIKMLEAIHEVLRELEKECNIEIKEDSLSYARFTTHVRYMIARIHQGEHLDLDMENYTKSQFPFAYRYAEKLIQKIGKVVGCNIDNVEIGYLAIHIERIIKINIEDK